MKLETDHAVAAKTSRSAVRASLLFSYYQILEKWLSNAMLSIVHR